MIRVKSDTPNLEEGSAPWIADGDLTHLEEVEPRAQPDLADPDFPPETPTEQNLEAGPERSLNGLDGKDNLKPDDNQDKDGEEAQDYSCRDPKSPLHPRLPIDCLILPDLPTFSHTGGTFPKPCSALIHCLKSKDTERDRAKIDPRQKRTLAGSWTSLAGEGGVDS